MKRTLLLVLVLALFLVLAACAPGDGSASTGRPAGFFTGIWHGWIAPVTLVIGLFNHRIRIYEVINSGWWYDLGYYMAVISGFGGLALIRNKKKNR